MEGYKIAFVTGQRGAGDATRGIGVYRENLFENIIKQKPDDLTLEAVEDVKNREYGFDLVHFTKFNPLLRTLPLKKTGKWVVTIHDLIQLIYPDIYVPGLKGTININLNKILVKRADKIISVSEATKKDIVRFLGIKAEKIEVIYEAADVRFAKIPSKNKLSEVRKKYGLPDVFILYVGDVNYNKNLAVLMKAAKITGLPLVICGRQAKNIAKLASINHPELKHLKVLQNEMDRSKVLILGYVDNDDLPSVYRNASVYVQPSLYEGFGLPVLEAMASGTPVVISKTQSMVEIAGGAALIADPQKPEELASSIREILENDALRETLREKGLKKSNEFSWRKSADKTLSIYKQLLSI